MSRVGDLARKAAARADSIIAASLAALALSVVPGQWLCAEATCRSAPDAVIRIGFVVGVAVGLAGLFSRTTRRWWSRVLVVLTTVLLAWPVANLVQRSGRWRVSPDAGSPCVVTVGASQADVLGRCGQASYFCGRAKQVQFLSLWNPLAVAGCGFLGDVYGDKMVVYDCGRRVASVEAAEQAGASPEWRPSNCVEWGRYPTAGR